MNQTESQSSGKAWVFKARKWAAHKPSHFSSTLNDGSNTKWLHSQAVRQRFAKSVALVRIRVWSPKRQGSRSYLLRLLQQNLRRRFYERSSVLLLNQVSALREGKCGYWRSETWPEIFGVKLTYVEESQNEALASKFDYSYVLTFFVEGKKFSEAQPNKPFTAADCKALFDLILS